MVITAAAALAVALAGGLTLLMDIEPSTRDVPVAVSSPQPSTPRPTLAPATIAPAPLQPRRPAAPIEIVSSPPPSEDPAASGPVPRIVGGPGISPGPVSHGRMELEAPPSEPEDVDKGPDWQAFTQVVVIGPGTLNLGGRKVQLAGIIVPESGARCRTAPEAEAFDCAFLSMQALRQRLRARGVECRLSALETIGVEPAACRIGNTDLSEWLVEQGWAEPAAGAPDDYRTAEDTARCTGAGIWAEAPRPDSCPAR